MFDGLKYGILFTAAGVVLGLGVLLGMGLQDPVDNVFRPAIAPVRPRVVIDDGVADALRVGSRVLVFERARSGLLIAGEIKQIATTNVDRQPLRGTGDYLARLQLEDGRERWIRLGEIEAAVTSDKRPRVPGGRGNLVPLDAGARGSKE